MDSRGNLKWQKNESWNVKLSTRNYPIPKTEKTEENEAKPQQSVGQYQRSNICILEFLEMNERRAEKDT